MPHPAEIPVNTFHVDIFNELFGSPDGLKESCFFLDDKVSGDLVGICTDRFHLKQLCFSLKKGLVYDTHAGNVFKTRTICQFSEPEPSNQMDNIFHYSLSFIDAFKSVVCGDNTVPIIRYVFVGDSCQKNNGSDLCAIAEFEAHIPGHNICLKQHWGLCLNHNSMFPFCLCTAHIHGCRTEYQQKIITPKVRVIMPLMEPLLCPNSFSVEYSDDANLLKAAFNPFKDKSVSCLDVHTLDSVNLRLK